MSEKNVSKLKTPIRYIDGQISNSFLVNYQIMVSNDVI